MLSVLVSVALASVVPGCRAPARSPPPRAPVVQIVTVDPDAGAYVTSVVLATAPPVPVPEEPGRPPVVCPSRHLGTPSTHHLLTCPAPIVEAIRRWRPDVLVTLGGGILGPGVPGCSTVQRAYATHQIFEALGREPWLLLSGHGPVEPVRAVDPGERTCAGERFAQETAFRGLPRSLRKIIARDQATLAAQGTAELTEADYLCAAVLAWYDPALQPTVLARMIFEPRSMSTVQNASYATALIGQRGLRRAVIISTPVVHRRGGLDNHPERALEDFRADRARGAHAARLAAVGCPFDQGGPAWSAFEGAPTGGAPVGGAPAGR